jgi:hypothetical protein
MVILSGLSSKRTAVPKVRQPMVVIVSLLDIDSRSNRHGGYWG